MNSDILKRLVNKEKIILSDQDAVNMLYDICNREHASCNNDCPIYDQVLTLKQREKKTCPYFNNGNAMLQGLRGHKIFAIAIDGTNKLITEKQLNQIQAILKK